MGKAVLKAHRINTLRVLDGGALTVTEFGECPLWNASGCSIRSIKCAYGVTEVVVPKKCPLREGALETTITLVKNVEKQQKGYEPSEMEICVVAKAIADEFICDICLPEKPCKECRDEARIAIKVLRQLDGERRDPRWREKKK